MTKKDSGGPAFPVPDGIPEGYGRSGMSLRDYFAGQMLANMGLWSPTQVGDFQARAQWAYSQADAMIEARKEGK